MARREDTSHLDAILSEPEHRQTLAESITGRLRQLILDGQLRPGQALRPADLAPRLGVSAMPVREALRILEAEGLVTFRPRIGARVAEIREEDVEELYLIRGALEGLAARLAATNLTDADLADIHEAFDVMTTARATQDFDTFSQYDKEFHRRQYAASGRPGPRQADPRPVGRRPADLRHHAEDAGLDRPGLRGAPGDPRGARPARRRGGRAPHQGPHRRSGQADPDGASRAARAGRGRRLPRASGCRA